MFNKRKIYLLKCKINELSERIDLMEYKQRNPFKIPIGRQRDGKVVIEHVIDRVAINFYFSYYKVLDIKAGKTFLVEQGEFEKLRK